jgi:hypothetical protein
MELKGSRSSLNRKLLLYAVKNRPSLVIDCANAANPHVLFPEVQLEELDSVYVIPVELIYTFRDVLKKVRGIAERLGVKCIVITPFNGLFHYDDERENRGVMEHAWELMRGLAERYEVVVGVSGHREGYKGNSVSP